MHVCVCIYAWANIHTYKYTYIHTNIHVRTHTHSCTHTYTHTPTNLMYTYIRRTHIIPAFLPCRTGSESRFSGARHIPSNALLGLLGPNLYGAEFYIIFHTTASISLFTWVLGSLPSHITHTGFMSHLTGISLQWGSGVRPPTCIIHRTSSMSRYTGALGSDPLHISHGTAFLFCVWLGLLGLEPLPSFPQNSFFVSLD